MNNTNNKATFWSLISRSRIERPTIQRDYTYGRKSTQNIREDILNQILLSVKEGEILHLDFVYGRFEGKQNVRMLEKNKQSIDSLLGSLKSYARSMSLKVDYSTDVLSTDSSQLLNFVPLDGQQRLTTLFLVHWYYAKICKDNESLVQLSKFTYSTRNSSKAFFNFLCSDHFELVEDNIVDSIKNHEHFFSFWENDPTVNSSIIVLNSIETISKKLEIDEKQALDALINSRNIEFDFFDLDDYELTDELYVKMNARGKKLTDFENFKAWLIKEKSKAIKVDNWRNKFDIKWTDLFWDRRPDSIKNIDDYFLQYFKTLFISDYLISKYDTDNTPKEVNGDAIINELRKDKSENTLSIFKQHSSILSDNLNDYLTFLDVLERFDIEFKSNKSFVSNNLLKFLLIHNTKYSWWHQTYAYAVKQYLLINDGNTRYFNQWNRVIQNLIFNSPIESPKLHLEACHSINNLIDRIKDQNVYDAFTKISPDEDYSFSSKQIKEEIRKAKLIIDNPSEKWEELFIDIESNSYFYGHIGFILDICKEKNIEEFKKLSSSISSLFSEDVLNEGQYLTYRALLTLYDDFDDQFNTLVYPSNIRGTLRNRNENWRRVFSNKEFKKVIFQLISHEFFDENNVIDSLEKIISNEPSSSLFVKTIKQAPKVLEYPNQNNIRREDKGYYLLKKTRIYGYYVELYTYEWYLRNKEVEGIKYVYQKKRDNLLNVGVKIKESLIYFDHSVGLFKITQKTDTFTTIDDAVHFIKNTKNEK